MLSPTNSNTSQSLQLSPTKSLTSQPKMLSHTNSTTSQSPQLSPTKSFTSQPKMLSHANSNTSQSPQLSHTTSLTSQQKMLNHSMSNTSQSKMLSPTIINSSQSPQLSHTTSNTSQPEKLSPIKLNSPQSQQLSPPIPTTSQNCTVNNNNGDKPCYQINSLNKKISLPHVYLKTSHADEKLCFLIDTGASVSLVKHARLQKPPPIDGSVIHIKGINSSENYSETLGSLQLHIEHPFPNNTTLSFDYKFHAVLSDINLDCDGIIGNDLLQSLDADVQYSTNTLLIQGYSLPIHFTQPVYIIPSRSIAIVECAVSNDESELSNCKVALIVDHTVSEGVYVSNCLATLKSNKRVNVSILNTTESDVKIIDYRVHLTPIDFNLEDAESTSESINKITLSNSSRSQQVLNNIRTSHLNEQEKKALLNCCSEFTDIFYLEGEPLSYTSAIKHSINTGDSPPIHVKSYRFPECHKEEVGKQIQKMLDQNIIIPSNSPWSAPVWVVPKKLDASGKRKWRVVIDYRKFNDVTVSEVYPLPLINDILDQLGHSKYFSTLDLASGFHQIAMDPQDADKTGFSVITNGSTSGHYQFTRMPFGLKNAPSTFQRLMNTALSGLQGLHCLVFLDDVIIYSHDLESHIQKLNLVFDKLRHFNLKLQPDKCEFLRREVAYLGHVITDKGVSPNPEKVKAVSEFPVPKNPKDVKSFLGLAGYYRRFIENFSKITKPLTSLLKKDACFHWSQEQQEAFNLLKDKLTSAPLLQYPNFEIPFVLTTDASNYASSSQKPRVDRFVPPRSSIEGVRQRWSLVKTWDVGADQNNWHSKYVHQRKFATHMEGAFGLSHPRTARDRGLAEDEVDSIQPWPCRPRKRSYLTSADSVLDLPTYRFALFPELLDWNSDDVLVAALGHKYYKWSWSRQGLVDSGYTQNPVYCCKFDPRGELLALGTAYCQVEVHHHGMTKRLAVSSCACARLVDDQCLITALDWSPTGNSFVTGCSHGMVCCFDRATSLVTRHRRACAGCVLRARISPDARYVAVSQVAAQFVLVMTWPQLVPYFSLEPNGWTVMVRVLNGLIACRISPDARYVAVSQVAAQFVLVMTWPQLVPYFSLEPNGWTVMVSIDVKGGY
ncbi:unnamed protein product [Plutella xylostella]|uniref:(diamondback moth) hypothetical protein n=1 Tax=Plutella xylostella TaxID=51655 RepID=A0A8S4D8B8_PLUXY|nr:unnamed protein product [Plutella xylostella]